MATGQQHKQASETDARFPRNKIALISFYIQHFLLPQANFEYLKNLE